MVLARRAVSRFSTRYSRKRFTLRQHAVLLCLTVKKTTTYRDLVDELKFYYAQFTKFRYPLAEGRALLLHPTFLPGQRH